jgi:dephospho-CoA kinase
MEYEVAWMDSTEKSAPDALLAIIEVPLLFEAKSDSKFARTIAVTTDPKKKLARFRSRHPELTEADAQAELERRSASQLADAEKARRAGLVIDNSGTLEETRAQVKKIYDELTRSG